MERFARKLKLVSLLWLEGFREACCFNRVVLCLRSRELAIRTGQCFLLNGFIFLGSMYVVRSFVIPTLQWVLPDGCQMNQEPCSYERISKFYPILRSRLIHLFYVLWFYPMYISSFILSMLWYGDIAKHGILAIQKHRAPGTSITESSSPLDSSASTSTSSGNKTTDVEGVVIGIAEQVYSFLLVNFFVLQVFAIGFIPLFGQSLSFILLTWLYAYSCFEYKWNHSGVSLDMRLNFFESNWPFFAGFGSPCVMAIFFYSPLVSYGVMAILFPLFVMTAAGSKADEAIGSEKRNWKGAGLPRLPIFCAADYLSMKVLAFLPTNTGSQRQKTEKAY